MTFTEAKEISKTENKAFKRPHWNDESLVIIEVWSTPFNNDYYPHGFPAMRTKEKFLVPWFGNVSDYLAIDWQIVE